MDLLDILSVLGGLVLFLYGIQALGDGLKAVSGGKMEAILARLTSNKWKGALLGAMVTAVIQSSGATIVMVIGFVNSGIMALNQAVGVILGANVGTTITAWLLSLTGIEGSNILLSLLKPRNFSPIVGIIGVFMMMLCKKDRQKQIGGILCSFAVLMLGMTYMSDGAAPLADDPAFTGLLTAFSNPFLGLLAGLVVTVLLQSSSASIGILQAISLTGTLKMSSAIPVIMGENIGSAITGVLGAIGANRNGRRTSLIQLFYCIIKTSVFMIGFYALNAIFHFAIMDRIASPVIIAVFHSIFNIAAVLLMLPFSDILIRLVEKAVPVTEDERQENETKKSLRLLDPKYMPNVSYAISQCKKAADQMADYTQQALLDSLGLVEEFDENRARHVEKLENIVDEYEDTINTYLAKIGGENFSGQDAHTFSLLVHCVGDFERMTDHALNVCQSTQQMHEADLHFSSKARDELIVFNNALRDIIDRACRAFKTGDRELAGTIEPLEEVIDGLNMEIKRRHVRRLRKGKCTIELGMTLEDITTDYERIADHCSNIGIYVCQVNEDGFDTHEYLNRLDEISEGEVHKQVQMFEQKYSFDKKEDETDTPSQQIRKEKDKGQAAPKKDKGQSEGKPVKNPVQEKTQEKRESKKNRKK